MKPLGGKQEDPLGYLAFQGVLASVVVRSPSRGFLIETTGATVGVLSGKVID